MENAKIALQVGGVIMMLDPFKQILWIVETLEQYLSIESEYGPFRHSQLRLVSEQLKTDPQPIRVLTGVPATMLAVNLLGLLWEGEPVRCDIPSGVLIQHWANQHEYVLVCYGHSQSSGTFFHILFCKAQVLTLQRELLAHNLHIQLPALIYDPLPVSTDSDRFTLQGEAAAMVIKSMSLL